MERVSPRKAQPGDKVAVLSPSFAAPAVAPAVHEQALERLRAFTGLVPVEFPTTRRLGATARDRADDLNAAFADPQIRAVLATIGGEDQITVVPHLDASLIADDPKALPRLQRQHQRSELALDEWSVWLFRRLHPGSVGTGSRSRPDSRAIAACCAADR